MSTIMGEFLCYSFDSEYIVIRWFTVYSALYSLHHYINQSFFENISIRLLQTCNDINFKAKQNVAL